MLLGLFDFINECKGLRKNSKLGGGYLYFKTIKIVKQVHIWINGSILYVIKAGKINNQKIGWNHYYGLLPKYAVHLFSGDRNLGPLLPTAYR